MNPFQLAKPAMLSNRARVFKRVASSEPPTLVCSEPPTLGAASLPR